MDKTAARVEFTKEMKKTHKLLFPNMSEIHFRILRSVFTAAGYDVALLTDTGAQIVDEGLKYVHNDTCYPALLTIGQLISALRSGKYDLAHTALMMSQTGGGCRASNYIHLLRRALKNAGLEQIPVISISLAGLEKNSGFKLTASMLLRALKALVFGDALMLLSNQTRPYEVEHGASDRLTGVWIDRLSDRFLRKTPFSRREMRRLSGEIAASYAAIEVRRTPKPRVGVVGEIYVKYCPLGNNGLEGFLQEQDCEVMVPGLVDFFAYSMYNGVEDVSLYGGSRLRRALSRAAVAYITGFEDRMYRCIRAHGSFTTPSGFRHLRALGQRVIGAGCKMGEGWLLPAEMMELTELGYENIVCTQPFGCLPNHIVGKGMLRKLRQINPLSNIVAVDYDPGATRVNQENRIKLMLAVARENLYSRMPAR